MKNLSFLFVLLLTISACNMSKQLKTVKEPELIFNSKTQNDSLFKKYLGEDVVYFNMDYSVEHYAQPLWGVSQIKSYSYLIINPDNPLYSTIELSSYPSKKLKNLFIRVISPENETSVYTLADCKNEKISANSTKYKFAYLNIVKGSIIQECFEYEYKNDYFNPKKHNFFLQTQNPILNQSITYIHPIKWKSQIKKNDYLHDKMTDSLDAIHKKRIITYQEKNIPSYKTEPYSPSLTEQQKTLEFKLNHLSVSSLISSYYYDASDDWDILYKPLSIYALSSNNFFTDGTEKKVKELTANCQSAYEMADSIFYYVQNEISVDHKDFDSSYNDIFKKKKGNIYKIVGLTRKMLSRAGINSEYVMCHDKSSGIVDSSYVDWDEFDTPALLFTIDSKTYLGFPYIKSLHFSNMPYSFNNEKAIIVKINKFNNTQNSNFNNEPSSDLPDQYKRGKMIDLPNYQDSLSVINESYDITINQDATLNIEENISFSRNFASHIRNQFDNKSKEETEKEIKDMLAFSHSNVKIDKVELLNVDKLSLPFIIHVKYQIDNLLTVLPDEIIMQTEGLLSPSSIKTYKVNPSDRQNPIYIPFKQNYEKHIKIHYPTDFVLQNDRLNNNICNKFGFFNSDWSVSDNTLIINQCRSLNNILSDKSEYATLLKISSEELNAQIPSIIFTKKELQ